MEKLTGGRMNTTPDKNQYSPQVIQAWYNRLHEYESLNLTPAEIKEKVEFADGVVRCGECGNRGAAFCFIGDDYNKKEDAMKFCSFGERWRKHDGERKESD